MLYYISLFFLLFFQIKAHDTENARFYHEQSNTSDKTNTKATDKKSSLKEMFQDFARNKRHALADESQEAYNHSVNNQLADKLIEDSPEEIKLILNRFEKSKKINDENIKRILAKKIILLAGEPGVGKSKLAIAIAQKLERPYRFVRCSTIENEYRNSGAQKIEEIFHEILATNEPVVVIFDEIHSILNQKKNEAKTDQDPAVALWQFLDVCKDKNNILIIGTTNILTNTHPAIKSRLNNHIIEISLPNAEKRERILLFYLNKYLDDKNLIKTMATKTEHFSCRDLEILSEEMILLAVDRDSSKINLSDFERSFNKIKEKIDSQKEIISSEFLNKVKDGTIDAGTKLASAAIFHTINANKWTILKYACKSGCWIFGSIDPLTGTLCNHTVDTYFGK